MRFLLPIPLLAAEALLQVSVISRTSIAGAAPQLVLLSVVAWSLLRGPMAGLYWGFAGGVLLDLASGGTLGISAFSLILVAIVAGLFGLRLFGSNPLLPLLAVFMATFVFFIMSAFLLATLHQPTDWRAVLVQVALPGAVANTALSLVVYPVFAFVSARTMRQVRVEF